MLVVCDKGRGFALDNRCPHMGFPLDRGSVEDGTLTCHWHHARFDVASGCTFDLWADDVPTCPAEVRDGEVWVRPIFGCANPAGHWRRRLDDGLAHDTPYRPYILAAVLASAIGPRLGRKVMEWFSQKTAIAGTPIPNWALVLGAVIIIWLFYRLIF